MPLTYYLRRVLKFVLDPTVYKDETYYIYISFVWVVWGGHCLVVLPGAGPGPEIVPRSWSFSPSCLLFHMKPYNSAHAQEKATPHRSTGGHSILSKDIYEMGRHENIHNCNGS